jgi:Ca2+-binding EF-hand superfamily protein
MSSKNSKITKLQSKTITKNGKKVLVRLDKLGEEQIRYFKKSFDELDVDSQGTIGIDEIIQYLDDIGIKMTVEEVKESYFEDDENGDYELDFEEFVARMALREDVIEAKPEPEPEPIDEVVDAFLFFTEQRKFIDILQLKSVLMNSGENKFTTEEFDEMMALTGHQVSDKFNVEEYVPEWKAKMAAKN